MCLATPLCACGAGSGCPCRFGGQCEAKKRKAAETSQQQSNESEGSLSEFLGEAFGEFLGDEAFQRCGFEYNLDANFLGSYHAPTFQDDVAERTREYAAPEPCFYGSLPGQHQATPGLWPALAQDSVHPGHLAVKKEEELKAHRGMEAVERLAGVVGPYAPVPPLPSVTSSAALSILARPRIPLGRASAAPSKRKRTSFPRATTAKLKRWLCENILNPYPKEEDKRALCKQCDLTISQLQTWFINARIRLWKPCIEHVYNLRKEEVLSLADSESDDSSSDVSSKTKASGCGGSPSGDTAAMIAGLKRLPDCGGAHLNKQVEEFMAAL